MENIGLGVGDSSGNDVADAAAVGMLVGVGLAIGSAGAQASWPRIWPPGVGGAMNVDIISGRIIENGFQ